LGAALDAGLSGSHMGESLDRGLPGLPGAVKVILRLHFDP
jgi:hypothetical protein